MSDQVEQKRASWLKVSWLLIALAIGFCLGLMVNNGTFIVALIIIILGYFTIKTWNKGRRKNAFELVCYIFSVGISGYGGLVVRYVMPFTWIIIGVVVFIVMIYIYFRYNRKHG